MTIRHNGQFRVLAAGIDDGMRFRLKEAAAADPRFILEERELPFSLPGRELPAMAITRADNLSDRFVASLPESGVPLIVSGSSSGIIAAFERGVADYLREPWCIEELLARCGRVASRFPIAVPGGFMTIASGAVQGPAGRVELSGAEERLLRLLCSVRGDFVTRADIVRSVGLAYGSRALEVHVCRLRGKLGAAVPAWSGRGKGPIACARGKGYRFL